MTCQNAAEDYHRAVCVNYVLRFHFDPSKTTTGDVKYFFSEEFILESQETFGESLTKCEVLTVFS